MTTLKKGKGQKSPDSCGGAAIILNYLREQNRPYSAIDISTNLHNKVTKGQVEVPRAVQSTDRGEAHTAKALKELVQQKMIEGRASGKQTVYHTLQELSGGVAPEAIAALDEDVRKFQDQLISLKAEDKQIRIQLAEFTSKPLLSVLREDIDRLQKEKEDILAGLANYGGGESAAASSEERQEIEKGWKYWQRKAYVRRRVCNELWARCLESVPEETNREELKESLGLEFL